MKTRVSGVLAASHAAYALLLRLCPAGYRREYGPPMAQAFHDLAREAYRQHGAVGLAALWARVLPDALATALAEHWATLRQGDGAGLRVVPTTLVLLSLLAPWYRFSDGNGTFPAWLLLVAGLLPGDWTLYHLLLVAMAVSLAAAALVGFRIGPLAARLSRWQPALLSAALACPVAYIWPRRPAVLWGAWLTAGCIAVAIVLEAALWVSARRRPLVSCAAEGSGAPPLPTTGGMQADEPGPTRRQGPGTRRRKALLVPLGLLALLVGAGLLVSAVLGWPFGGGGADGAYAEACRALTAAQEMPVRAWKETLLWRAIGKFSESLRADPENASALCNRGNAYAGLGWYDEAVADYGSALAILPMSADITKNRGLAYERWGKPREALADYEAFLGLIAQAPGERRAWERDMFAGKVEALQGRNSASQ